MGKRLLAVLLEFCILAGLPVTSRVAGDTAPGGERLIPMAAVGGLPEGGAPEGGAPEPDGGYLPDSETAGDGETDAAPSPEAEPTPQPEGTEPSASPEGTPGGEDGETTAPTETPGEAEPSASPEETPGSEDGEPTAPTESPEGAEPSASPEETPDSENGEPTAPTETPGEGEPSASPEETPGVGDGETTPPTESPEGAEPSASPEGTTPPEGEQAPDAEEPDGTEPEEEQTPGPGEEKTYSAQLPDSGATVTAALPPEANLPEGALFHGEKIDETSPDYETMTEAVREFLNIGGEGALQFLPFDLYFTGPEDEAVRIEPEGGPVQITITYPADPFEEPGDGETEPAGGESAAPEVAEDREPEPTEDREPEEPAPTAEPEEVSKPAPETGEPAPEPTEPAPEGESQPRELAKSAPAEPRRVVLRFLDDGGVEKVEARWSEDNTSVTFTVDSLSPVGLALVLPRLVSVPIASADGAGEEPKVEEVKNETELKDAITKAEKDKPVILKLAQPDSFWINNTIVVDGKNIILVGSADTYTVKVNVNNADKSGFEVTNGGSLTIGLPGSEYGDLHIKAQNGNISSLIKCGAGCTFILNSGTIDANKQKGVRGVLVSGGTFTMNGGTIQNGNNPDGAGGGVHVSNKSGVFTMNGGTITNCMAGNGGGVSLYKKSIFTMNGGDITNCKAGSNGGGVYADENSEGPASVTVSNGTISGCSAQSGGGIYVARDNGIKNPKNPTATLSISGGTISGCTATQTNNGGKGGGVYFKGKAFTFSGGTVTGCRAEGKNNSNSDGGGIYVTGSGTQLTMSGGTVTDCHANHRGGGIYFAEGQNFTLSAGGVTKCEAKNGEGGGMFIDKIQMFSMTGGNVSDNTANHQGGGIFFYNGGLDATATTASYSITAGTITGNSLTDSEGLGGGIFVDKGITFHLHNTLVTGNTATLLGGGLWACRTGDIRVYVTDGGAIYDNTAGSSGSSAAAGDDIAFVSSFGSSILTLYKHMLGGGLNQYYRDGGITYGRGAGIFGLGAGMPTDHPPRYNAGYRELYDKTESLTGFHAIKNVPTDSAKAGARQAAALVISGNKAGRGGGIGTNGNLEIGTPKETYLVTILKKWSDDTPEAKKTPVSVYLEIDGKSLGPYTLSAENNWTVTIDGLTSDPATAKYAVVEDPVPEGFRPVYQDAMIEDHKITLEFTNQYLTGSLTVKKTVIGNGGDKQKEFHFRVELSDTSINGPYGEMLFTDGVAEFTLKDGESKTATKLPSGITYTVTETEANQDGYTTTPSGETGTIPGDGEVTAEFVNERILGGLTVTKTVGDGGDRERPWHFRVELSDTSIQGQYGDMFFTDGVAEFTLKHGESKTAWGLPEGVTYTVTEAEANQEGYSTTKTGDTGTIPGGGNATADFVNDRPGVTLTGDDSHFGFWLGLTGVSALGALLAGLLLLRGRGKGGYRGRHIKNGP